MNAPLSRALSAALLTVTAVSLAGCSLLPGVPEGEQDVFSIEIGDCLNDQSAQEEVTSVPIVDCSEPHDAEVFARTDSTSSSFPGADALFAELDAFCQGDAYTTFVGIPFAESVYYTSGYIPTDESWDNGDRELLCTIIDENGQVTGSLKGVAR